MRFENKVAVVLGGNSGIGLAAAGALASEGATLCISGRDEATLAGAKHETGAVLARRCDMADLAALDEFYAAVSEQAGRIDILLANAGTGTFTAVRDITPELWDSVHAVNLRGAFFAAQKALALMGRGGSIVFTGSIGGVLGLPGNCVYASSKAGLRAIVRNMATELVGEGIRVNLVSPGPTETPIINRSGLPPDAVDEMRRQMIEAVPMKRMGEPEEIANALLFLASDEASFITGVDLYVDGGCVEIG
jgi:NAD(P)-dependent dehydrogenase (short-subunit alcohol dehydrogenase family)